MTNDPEWMECFNEKFRSVSDSGHEFCGKYGGNNGQILPIDLADIKAFIQDTIKEEKEKAKSELLSKIEEEVELIDNYYGNPKAKKMVYLDEVLSSLSKYKVNK